jgi:hypothetical protein
MILLVLYVVFSSDRNEEAINQEKNIDQINRDQSNKLDRSIEYPLGKSETSTEKDRDPSENVESEYIDANFASDVQMTSDLASDPIVRGAIDEAFRIGGTVRWESQGLRGYAVASTANSEGCRQVRYSVDNRPADEFPNIKICP